MPRLALLILVAVAGGCANLQQMSSGHVGCAPGEIAISDEDKSMAGHSWTAACGGQTYYCSTHGGGGGSEPLVACAPANGASASVASPEPNGDAPVLASEPDSDPEPAPDAEPESAPESEPEPAEYEDHGGANVLQP